MSVRDLHALRVASPGTACLFSGGAQNSGWGTLIMLMCSFCILTGHAPFRNMYVCMHVYANGLAGSIVEAERLVDNFDNVCVLHYVHICVPLRDGKRVSIYRD